jgi:hypothetical protein
LFAPRQYAASGDYLLDIFINRPPRSNQKDIFQRLVQINQIRNRIAHHEPICFYGNSISTVNIEYKYNIILELLSWLGCTPCKILYGIDKVPLSISRIKNI